MTIQLLRERRTTEGSSSSRFDPEDDCVRSETDRTRFVREWITASGWVEGPFELAFLAAGEYNENYLLTDRRAQRSVVRLNHGSQLGRNDQIAYEYNVLKAVEASHVTPRPFRWSMDTGSLADGIMQMEYLPGVHLDYRRDSRWAATVFAAIHQLPLDERLEVQSQPIRDIADECLELLTRYPSHPLKEQHKQLRDYHTEIVDLADRSDRLFADEPRSIVNTEVNSSNFLISEDSAYLVDWEKAVVSYRYQDLGHFLTPTTTLWKSDHIFSEEEKLYFLEEYRERGALSIPMDELRSKTRLLERTILLRGLSWCYMAYYEYMRADRALVHSETEKTIKRYMDRVDWFLGLLR
jgi:thiamine kinase-like enzyme